jgi:hypothetical protein
MKHLARRIQEMEVRQPVGCATCRHWHGVIITDSFGGRNRSDRCPACGRDVPVTRIIFLEGVPWDCV